MHWLPAPASATVVDVVDGGLTTVRVVAVEVVVVVATGALGAEVRVGVLEQPVRMTTKANAVTKSTRSRFTSRNYPSSDNKSRSSDFAAGRGTSISWPRL